MHHQKYRTGHRMPQFTDDRKRTARNGLSRPDASSLSRAAGQLARGAAEKSLVTDAESPFSSRSHQASSASPGACGGQAGTGPIPQPPTQIQPIVSGVVLIGQALIVHNVKFDYGQRKSSTVRSASPGGQRNTSRKFGDDLLSPSGRPLGWRSLAR